MANQGSLVRVNRGDGNLIKMTPKQAEEYIAANPGASIVPTPAAPSDDVAMPQTSESPAEEEAEAAPRAGRSR